MCVSSLLKHTVDPHQQISIPNLNYDADASGAASCNVNFSDTNFF